MVRPVLVSICLVAASAGAVGVANAYPIPTPPPCTFALSGPATEGESVTATVESVGCAALAVPYSTVACLRGAQGVTQCAQSHGLDPARVSVAYQPGVAYEATGRGCAGWVNLEPHPNCQVLGPNQ